MSTLPTDHDGWAVLRKQLILPHHPWLLDHDAKQHALDSFMTVVDEIRAGTGDERKYSPEMLQKGKINLDNGEMLMGERSIF